MRKSILAAGLVFGVAFFAGNVGATTLADLLAGGSITVGDKTFSNFSNGSITCTGVCAGSFAGINVTGGTFNGLIGLDFSGGLAVGSSSDLDIKFEYDVTATAPLITDFHMDMNGTLNPTNGNINVNIVETAFSGGNPVGLLTVFDKPTLTLSAGSTFSPAGPYQKLTIVKDINLVTDANTTANLSDFKQTFSQVVPEPASIGLLGTALVGLAWLVRRKKQA